MTNEIKEILEDLEWRAKSHDIWYFMEQEKCKILYDYITNLQEENKEQRNIIVEKDGKIKKAIEYLNKHTNNEVEYLDIIEVKELKNILEGDDK